MNKSREAVETYIRAKDSNRPWLMGNAFSAKATLEMIVNTETIAFPPISHGIHAISDVLVRRFAQTYENVHTFCLASPPRPEQVQFACPWLVGMSEKDGGAVRIGSGRYNWLFQSQDPGLVERLSITVDTMETLAPDCLTLVMDWLSRLPYPWCPASVALERAPLVKSLHSIREHLRGVLTCPVSMDQD